MKKTYHGLKVLSIFLLLVSTMSLASVAGEVPTTSPLTSQFQVTVIPKYDDVDLYVVGVVTKEDQVTPLAGALVTVTYNDEDGIEHFYFYEYSPSSDSYYPNYGLASHSTTAADGQIHIYVKAEPDELFWEAKLNVCVTLDGYQVPCQVADFENDDRTDSRDFRMQAIVSPTPTPTVTETYAPTLTETPTATMTEMPSATMTPTLTETPSGKPTAVHPELDVDHDGVIGAGDLLLLMADWLRPVN